MNTREKLETQLNLVNLIKKSFSDHVRARPDVIPAYFEEKQGEAFRAGHKQAFYEAFFKLDSIRDGILRNLRNAMKEEPPAPLDSIPSDSNISAALIRKVFEFGRQAGRREMKLEMEIEDGKKNRDSREGGRVSLAENLVAGSKEAAKGDSEDTGRISGPHAWRPFNEVEQPLNTLDEDRIDVVFASGLFGSRRRAGDVNWRNVCRWRFSVEIPPGHENETKDA